MTFDPLYCPRNGCRTFAVSVYNADVRRLLKDNRSHAFFHDDWANEHCQRVTAKDADEARALTYARLRREEGFVVTEVVPLSFG
ncbi:hypothetical protein RIEGSTA812A_PEG_1057 [invertebrate metagenome]|uniref:Uncharacterized protein n=1 Tax=invertebrate metagenome TaxID=1711999 RepID=A0A484H794_9ZZZZ